LVNAFPRESVEFQPVTVTRDGFTVSTGVSFAIVPDGQRPVTFTAAVTISGKTGIMVTGLAAGTYRIFAKIAGSPEVPVIDCGYFYIT
jgi:hypothetical protein